jgi:hypothetical protein
MLITGASVAVGCVTDKTQTTTEKQKAIQDKEKERRNQSPRPQEIL